MTGIKKYLHLITAFNCKTSRQYKNSFCDFIQNNSDKKKQASSKSSGILIKQKNNFQKKKPEVEISGFDNLGCSARAVAFDVIGDFPLNGRV